MLFGISVLDIALAARLAGVPYVTELEQGELEARFKESEHAYGNLVEEMKFAISNALRDEALSVAAITGRVKEFESFLRKVETKSYTKPFEEIEDFAGVRVVCLYTADIQRVVAILRRTFEVLSQEDKTASLGADRMGYQGTHLILRLGPNHVGARYDRLSDLKCEAQVRTIMQDAWAQVEHGLVYKSSESVPEDQRREINHVSVLLEIGQGIFDRMRESLQDYVEEIEQKLETLDFLDQKIDRETLSAYTRWRYPDLPIKEDIQELLIRDLDHDRFRTLADIEASVKAAEAAVSAYSAEKPEVFKSGTDFLTKSLGFSDEGFRAAHPFAAFTRAAFQKYQKQIDRQ